MKTMDQSRLEAVGQFLTRIDADIACGALNAAGIEAVVAADDAAGTRPHLWLSDVRILVRAEDVEQAMEILRAAETASDQIVQDTAATTTEEKIEEE